MSEENRWDEDLPEVNENVPTEEKPLDTFGNTDTGSAADNSTENIDIAQKPMAHPYSAGRRMQENGYGNGTNSSNFQNNTSFQEKPKYAHYEVHQPQAGNYAEEVFHRRNLINRRQLMEAGTAALERRLQQPLPWQ